MNSATKERKVKIKTVTLNFQRVICSKGMLHEMSHIDLYIGQNSLLFSNYDMKNFSERIYGFIVLVNTLTCLVKNIQDYTTCLILKPKES